MSVQEAHHFAWRAGFGPAPSQPLPDNARRRWQAYWTASQGRGNPLTAWQPGMLATANLKKAQQALAAQPMNPAVADSVRMAVVQELSRPEIQAQVQAARQTLNYQWLEQMAFSPMQLREKMALFWADHFGVRVQNVQHQQQYLNCLRDLALGDFQTLLLAVARQPAMLQFLNNQQNRKQRPNENFARELLELFTLGRGHYTEADVKEAARAFTGWGMDFEGNFLFRRGQHDFGPKTFWGQSGNWTGEDIIRIILAQPQCARFLTQKLLAWFVTDTPDPAWHNQLARDFAASGYRMETVLAGIFTHERFAEPGVIGRQVKSPVVLLAGLMRGLDLRFGQPQHAVFLLRLLGQIPTEPPNVAGWPAGTQWIDTSSMTLRMKLPEVLLTSAALNLQPKDDGDDDERDPVRMRMRPAERQALQGYRQIEANTDFQALSRQFAQVNADDVPAVVEAVSRWLLQMPLNEAARRLVEADVRQQAQPARRLFHAILRITALPEYQLA